MQMEVSWALFFKACAVEKPLAKLPLIVYFDVL